MAENPELIKMTRRLREAMKTSNGDLEKAVQSVLKHFPGDASLLHEIIAGAQASQARDALQPDIRRWLKTATSNPRIRHLADTLSATQPTMSSRIIAGIAQQRPDLAEALKNAAFSFDDLEFIDKKGMQTLVRKVDKETLLLSLRGLDGAVRDRILESLSDRNRRDILDELEWMRPVRRAKVEEARQFLVNEARSLLARGVVFLMKPDDPDPYIE